MRWNSGRDGGKAGLYRPGHPRPTLNLVGVGNNRIGKQPTFARRRFVKAYSRAGGFLEEIVKTFDWSAFDVILRPLHSSCEGAPAYPPLTMFKIVLLQQWYALSDRAAEEAVRDRLSFDAFAAFRWMRRRRTSVDLAVSPADREARPV